MTHVRNGFIVGCLLLAACDNSIFLDDCDIRQAACQEDVFLAVQRVRGNSWDPWLDMPPMRVITQDQYRAELQASYDEATADPDYYDYTTPAFKLFGLIDPNAPEDENIDYAANFFIAYYDPSEQTVTIIDRGDATDRQQDTRTLAHELVHAAQDRDIGFDQIYSGAATVDASAARSALVEGEARLYENLVDLLIEGIDPTQVNWDGYHASWLDGVREDVANALSPSTVAGSSLRYVLGSRYLTSAWLEGGSRAVRATFEEKNRPSSAIRLMDDRGSRLDVEHDPLRCASPEPAAGFSQVRSTSRGAWSLYAFATRMTAETQAWHMGETWDADRFSVYSNDAKQIVAIWQIDFGALVPAQTFIDALSGLPVTFDVQSAIDGSVVTLFATDVTEQLDWPEWSVCRVE